MGSPVGDSALAEKVAAAPAAAEQEVPPAGPLSNGGSRPAGSSVAQGGSPRQPSVQELSALLAAKLLRQVKEGSTGQLAELFLVLVRRALTPGEATALSVWMLKQGLDNAGLCTAWWVWDGAGVLPSLSARCSWCRLHGSPPGLVQQ